MKFRVFVFLLFMPLVLCFAQNDESEWYQGKPIKEIVFSGLKNITTSQLDGLMNPYKGQVFTDNLFFELMGKLYALEYFEHIEPSLHRANADGSEIIIRFSVIERPIISRINFIGNQGLRRAELLDTISSKVSDIYNQAKVRVDIEAIKNKYIEKGYPNVVITTSETKTNDLNIALNFHITENELITISRIEFQGNTKYSSNALRGQLSLKAKSLLNNGAFQEAKLLADRDAVTKYYHDRGYIDAVVRDVTRTFEADGKKSGMILTFMIEEGHEFKFGGISFEGNVIFTTEQLQKLITSKVDEIVNMTRLGMDIQRVADLYYENGYIFNTISPVQDKNSQTNMISYNIFIIERSRAYVENIIIIGNQKTKNEVILREIPLEPGDVFSRTKIMEALRNLYNLQYFSNVMPDTLPGSAESLMDLVFTLEEQPTTDIQFGLTFSGSADPDTFPISGLIKWTDRNIFGSGNEFGAELNSSVIDTTTFSLNYLHRWVFGLPLSLGIDLSVNYTRNFATMDNQPPFFNGDEEYAFPDGFYSRDEYESGSRLPTRDYLMEYNQWYLSVGFSTGYRWFTFLGIFGINGGIRFGMLRNEYDNQLFRPFDPTLRQSNNQWTPRNSVYISLSLDQRDIFYDPSKGYYAFQRFSLYGLFNEEREHYIRTDTKIQYFIKLFDIPVNEKWNFKSVLALHAGLSTLLTQFNRDGKDLPTIEDRNKLSIDGMFVGRGWSRAYQKKGFLLFDSWVELRFPVVPGFIAFDFFFDAAAVEEEQGYYFGTNSSNKPNFTIESFRFSYGGGFRFTMPQFPIRLSLVKCFSIVDGNVKWEPGALFGDPNKPWLGMDLVMSFNLSY
ncbi:MAG: outer membrane protein assembly factor BamA [Treponema sp.]|nr:outer membrane protein assembly factor BamA [Treponema sp.]MCL2250355.1 outer membrane protein assembly factor BamA [Treponema sp.]